MWFICGTNTNNFVFVLELSEIPFCELEELKNKIGSKRYINDM